MPHLLYLIHTINILFWSPNITKKLFLTDSLSLQQIWYSHNKPTYTFWSSLFLCENYIPTMIGFVNGWRVIKQRKPDMILVYSVELWTMWNHFQYISIGFVNGCRVIKQIKPDIWFRTVWSTVYSHQFPIKKIKINEHKMISWIYYSQESKGPSGEENI